MNYTNHKLLQDLELDNKIIPKIDHTITTYGKNKFRDLFNILYYGQNNLLRRKEIITSIIQNEKNKKQIVKELQIIKKREKYVAWLFDSKNGKKDKEFKDLYFTKEFFNNEDLLSTSNYLKIYSPSIILIVYLFIYIFLRYYGININIQDYLYGIYESTKFAITGMLMLVSSNFNLISFLTNMLATLYILYQLYCSYNSFDSSVTHYCKCSDFNKNINGVMDVIYSINRIYKLDNFFVNEKQLISHHIKEINKVFNDSKINKLGYKLLLKKNCKDFELSFNSTLQYIGLIDSFINIASLVQNNGYIFPTFDFNKDQGPYIKADGLWSPYISSFEQITNPCYLGEDNPNIMILTGPNTSGKSTYMRNIMIAILLSQTIGITCAEDLVFTPFNSLFTYLDIPNVYRDKESLFEAEVMRCMEYCKMIEEMNSDQYAFTIIDEMFTGTNPKEGIASSYSVCEYLGNFKNSINIITTHFMELTELEKQHPNNYINMRFHVIKNEDGSFYRPYLLEFGSSEQHIAIELLKQKGYDNVIVARAIEKLNEL